MKRMIFITLVIFISGCKVQDDLRFDTAMTYGKTIKLIAPSSEYFVKFNDAFKDGVISHDEFEGLELIYRKHLVEFEQAEDLTND